MSVGLAIFTYLMLVALVSLLMLYYYKVIRPNDERRFEP